MLLMVTSNLTHASPVLHVAWPNGAPTRFVQYSSTFGLTLAHGFFFLRQLQVVLLSMLSPDSLCTILQYIRSKTGSWIFLLRGANTSFFYGLKIFLATVNS